MSEWALRRLDWLVTEKRRTVSPADLSVDEVFHYSIPAFDALENGRLEPPGDIGSAKLLLSGGEVLLSKLNPRIPRVLLAASHPVPTIASTEFIALRPGPEIEQRFLRYWLISHRVGRDLDGATMSVTRSQQRIRPEILTKRWVRFPPVAGQGAIADYLDTETARIDALIAKKQRLWSVLAEKMRGSVDEAVLFGDVVPVRRVISRLTSGPRGWAEYVSDGGGETPFLRITNIRRDGIELDRSDLLMMAAPRNAEALRTTVRTGDVFLSITADIGSVGIAREQDVGAAVSQHVALMTPAGCEPEWLAYSIASSFARGQLGGAQYGGTKTQLSLGDVASLAIRLPQATEQELRLTALREELGRLQAAREALWKQLGLLREHRQALITAAVTGDLDVQGAV